MADDPILRPWKTSDAPALLRHLRAAPDLANELPPMTDVSQARAWIEERQGQWWYAIVDNGVALGNVGVGHVNRQHSVGWLSYWMSMQGRAKGWTKRAVCTVVDHVLFDAPDPIFRVEVGHRVNNVASGRIAQAAGFIEEGHERQKLQYNGVRHDTITYGRLRTDPRPVYERLVLEA